MMRELSHRGLLGAPAAVLLARIPVAYGATESPLRLEPSPRCLEGILPTVWARPSPVDVDDPWIDPTGALGWGRISLQFHWLAKPRMRLGLRLLQSGDNDRPGPGSGIDAPSQDLCLWLDVEF